MIYSRSYKSHIKLFHVFMGYSYRSPAFTPLSLPWELLASHTCQQNKSAHNITTRKKGGEDAKLYTQHVPIIKLCVYVNSKCTFGIYPCSK